MPERPATPDDAVPHVDELTGYLLIKTSAMTGRSVDRALRRHGLTGRLVRVLAFIRDQAQAPSQRDLCGLTGLDRTTMVAVVDDLEQRGFARRERSTADRRKYVVTLTESGADAYRAALGDLLRTQDELLAPLSATERGQFHSMLARVFVAEAECEGAGEETGRGAE
ncbi:MarR family transcriptional regulator [Streptomyces sp. NA04227]|uniref:MarR family winged helix-turn-helix transcriptional regulator n=1 Tax=Streptomyces sp. NA04227 TaxID=2742136 RepID=UPI00159181E5|nr:MarR family transcriptional regulator [Streptomyces sp. NA04227]QKW07944.1 MarR family transcriptional regulator [Streptomyces sp. NA04227]